MDRELEPVITKHPTIKTLVQMASLFISTKYLKSININILQTPLNVKMMRIFINLFYEAIIILISKSNVTRKINHSQMSIMNVNVKVKKKSNQQYIESLTYYEQSRFMLCILVWYRFVFSGDEMFYRWRRWCHTCLNILKNHYALFKEGEFYGVWIISHKTLLKANTNPTQFSSKHWKRVKYPNSHYKAWITWVQNQKHKANKQTTKQNLKKHKFTIQYSSRI